MNKKSIMIFILTGLLSLFLYSCEKKPVACPTCKGTGKITQSSQEPLSFKVVNHKLTDRGIINPDYFLNVSLENKGDKDGTFKIYADFLYKDIGQHTEETELFIKAHSTDSKIIRYDADKYADSYSIRVQPPVVIKTSESICPACQGKGMTS